MKFFYTLSLFLLSVLFTQEGKASHAMGTDLQYTYLGMDQYQITLKFYRDCTGIPVGSSFSVTVANTGCGGATSMSVLLNQVTTIPCPFGGVSGSNGCEVSPLCPAYLPQTKCASPPGVYPGVKSYVYTGVVTLPTQCSQWVISFTEGSRNPSSNIVGGSANNLSIQAMINNTINPVTGSSYANNSVNFSELPTPFKCQGVPTTYNHGGVEPDGDSLVYKIVKPLGNAYAPINYNAGWGLDSPIKTTSGFVFNSNTGQMTFTPSTAEVDVLALRVEEWRNGVMVGYTMRDVQVNIISSALCPPHPSNPKIGNVDSVLNGNLIDTVSVQTCPGTNLKFSVLIRDPALTLTVTSTLQLGILSPLPGAIFDTVPVGNGIKDSVRAYVSWTPSVSDTGCVYFNINAKNNDCPVLGSSTKVYKVCVLTKVIVTPHNAIFCGDSIQLAATGGSHFSWTPAAGLSNSNTYTPKAGPAAGTTVTYIFTSDCGSDSSTIVSFPPFNLDAGAGGTICVGGQLPLLASVDNTYSPYKIHWTPSSTLQNPISGASTDSILNPTASPIKTTTYTVAFTANNGCVRSDTVTVHVDSVGQAIKAHANPTIVCPGSQTQLTLVGTPSSCGLSVANACAGINMIDSVKGGATANQAGTPSAYPSPYGNYYKSARHQYLIKKADLLAVFPNGGKITSLAMQVTNLTSAATLTDFTIKIGCTQKDSLIAYDNAGLVTVFSPKTVTPTAGWNTHVFDFAYDWDGNNDILVDMCFNNTTNGNNNNKFRLVTLPYRVAWFTWDNNINTCGQTGVQQSTPISTTLYQRPLFKFNMCVANMDAANITWTPNTGVNKAVTPNNDTTLAFPQNTTTYQAALTNSNGCISKDFVTVYVDSVGLLDVTPDTFICSIQPVQLHAKVSGSSNANALNYIWTANVGTAPPSGTGIAFANPIVNPSVPTVYTCTINLGSCTVHDTVNVVIGTSIPATLQVTPITCFGANNGKIKVQLNGGIAPITYTWSPSAATGNVDSAVNLTPTTYSVSISDNIGCTGTASVTLNQPPVLTLTMDSQNVTCFGANNGSVTTVVAGGTPSYTYTWSPSQFGNQANLSNKNPNLYKLTVTDGNGCTISGQKNIKQPALLLTTTNSNNVSGVGMCDGSGATYPVGGTLPYTYSWSPGGGSTDSIAGKCIGTYYVTITDAHGCSIIDSVVIASPPPILLTKHVINNVCAGDSLGSIKLKASGGVSPYTFNWGTHGMGDSIYKLVAGPYTVTVTDSNGISVTATYTITAPSALANVFDSSDVSCHGGSNGWVSANVSGGTAPYFYVWTPALAPLPNGNTFTNASAGTYIVSITDMNGCKLKDTTTLVDPPLLIASIVNTDSVICFGQSNGVAEVLATGGTPGYTYSWIGSNLNTPIANNFAAGAGIYSAIVTDSKGCKDTVGFDIYQPLQLLATINPTDAHCIEGADGSAVAVVTNGVLPYTYTWDGVAGSASISNLTVGAHVFVATDAKGCQVTSNFAIAAQYVLQATATATDVSCFGGSNGKVTSSVLNGNAPYIYNWSPSGGNGAIATGLTPDTYIVNVSDKFNCTATATATVNQPAQITVSVSGTNPSCAGKLDGKAWANVTNAIGAISYQWQNSITDTSFNLVAGQYTVTVTDANLCQATNSITLVDPNPLSGTSMIQKISCANSKDGKISIDANGGTPTYSLMWNDSTTNPILNNLGAGNYSVTITDAHLCTYSMNFTLAAPSALSFNILHIDSPSCPNYADGFISLDMVGGTPSVTQPYTYSLDSINYQNSSLFTHLAAGVYHVFVRDANHCDVDSIVTVTEPLPLAVSILPQDSSIALGGSLTLVSTLLPYTGSSIHSYTWTPSAGLSCADCANPVASPYDDTDYQLTINYLNNCTASTHVKVKVNDGPDLYIPNAFSPNGDGNNDAFQVYGTGLKTMSMRVFDRWGEKIFDGSSQFVTWDGTYRGQLVASGIYTYSISIEYLNGKKKDRSGSITIIR